MKKKTLLALACAFALHGSAQNWSAICDGKKGAAWYGSQEAVDIADIVVSVQKDNGGWDKNKEMHKLSDSDYAKMLNDKKGRSCLDNGATTQEMCFLARVYSHTKDAKYRESFNKALNMIFKVQKAKGGWSQYYPLSGNGSYHDYITFNDDLVTRVMKLLKDINDGMAEFDGLLSENMLAKCQDSYNLALDMVLRAQVDDNGYPSAWCAQHDPDDLLPAHGRPHEHPSVSGSESAKLLSFLMTLDNPSAKVQKCIVSAVKWFDKHKIPNKKVVDFNNPDGQKDRRVVDAPGSDMWGRFIQFGGATAEKVYKKYVDKLKTFNKTRTYTQDGKAYSYKEHEIAEMSYDPSKAYQPIFGIYDNNVPHLYYRFLYSYEDTPYATDWKGCSVPTSLAAGNRSSYQYLGNWLDKVIDREYPAWVKKWNVDEKKIMEEIEIAAGIANAAVSKKEEACTKWLENGMLMIKRNGNVYNDKGQLLDNK